MDSQKEYGLTNNSIDEIAESVTAFLTELKTERKNLLRLRLLIEEILLDWQTHFFDQAEISVKMGKRWGGPISRSIWPEKRTILLAKRMRILVHIEAG